MRLRTTLAVLASLTLLTACGTAESGGDAEAAEEEAGLTLEDGWAKATEDAMTGVFGTLTNTTDEEIHLVGVDSGIADHSELHVTVDDGAGGRMMMEAEDGFVIPAGGEHELVPGGDHLMLMQLNQPVETGQDVDLTLLTEDGQMYVATVTARAFSGAEEHYAPGHGDDDAGATEGP